MWPMEPSETCDAYTVCNVRNVQATLGHEHRAKEEYEEVRNLLNRTRLALGAPPGTLPSRDNPNVSKIAAMIYTECVGPLDGIFDRRALSSMIHDGSAPRQRVPTPTARRALAVGSAAAWG